MTRIELIATDGTVQRKILWIDAKPNGIYYSFCERERDKHMSYHSDGKMFETVDGIVKQIGERSPLIGFKGRMDMITFGFVNNLTQVRGVGLDYNLGRVDAAIYLDMRTYVNEGTSMNCTIELLEPDCWDLLKGIGQYRGLRQVHVFTSYNPWILIRIQVV